MVKFDDIRNLLKALLELLDLLYDKRMLADMSVYIGARVLSIYLLEVSAKLNNRHVTK